MTVGKIRGILFYGRIKKSLDKSKKKEYKMLTIFLTLTKGFLKWLKQKCWTVMKLPLWLHIN